MNPISRSSELGSFYSKEPANINKIVILNKPYIDALFRWFECTQSAYILSSNLINRVFPQVYAQGRTLQDTISMCDEAKMSVQMLTPFFGSVFSNMISCPNEMDANHMINASDRIDMILSSCTIQDNNRVRHDYHRCTLLDAQQESPFISIDLDCGETDRSYIKNDTVNLHHNLYYYDGFPTMTKCPETVLFNSHSSREYTNLKPMTSQSTYDCICTALTVKGKLEKANVSYH
ncbi:MAG: hypothetical protein SVY53_10825 [Chloroflexota bacterium]|nr:hypothetical protein [Chloroflexota bacterium]